MSTVESAQQGAAAMTDRELAAFGERLYEAILLTPLPAGTILGLATAIRCNMSWTDLPRALRFAVFKIAAACVESPLDEDPVAPPDQPEVPGFDGQQTAAQPATQSPEQPAQEGQDASAAGGEALASAATEAEQQR